ncbi:extracellular solute-binding protein [Streptomyces sp. NPDC051776]|uniref:extracellular solute-binding protein n=1 Tax=Streptomyces sp. NPDC051776 TaxID=3155414 RepID=UPI003440732B
MQPRYLGIVTAGVAAMLASTLSGCGQSEAAGSGDATIKLVAAEYGDRSGNSSKRYWDQLAGEFEFKHPGISVDVDVYTWKEVDKKVAAMVKAGHAPDIAQIGSYADYAAQNKLYRADEMLSIPTQAGFIPALADAGKVRRIQYGLPFVASTRVLFYNKDLFAKAGLSGPPKTWDELASDAEALERAGVKTPYALPLGPEEPQAETLNWMLSGGAYHDDIGSYTIDSPQNIRTFTWLRDALVGEGLTNRDPGSMNRQDAFDAFTRGDAAMLNGHPTLMQLAQENGIDFGMAPLPGRNGRSKATTGVADWMMAFRQNGHREEIGTFLDFVYSKRNVLKFADQYDLLPVTTDASEAMRADENNKAVWKFLDELPTARSYPVGKRSWSAVAARLKSEIGDAVTKDGDPASVLGSLQREAETTENAASSS